MLLTVDQAAERLGTTTRFIRRLRTERRIAVIKLGKHIRIDSADLDAYITANRQEPQPRSTLAGLTYDPASDPMDLGRSGKSASNGEVA